MNLMIRRALIEGRKTQTRRIINPQPDYDINNDGEGLPWFPWFWRGRKNFGQAVGGCRDKIFFGQAIAKHCPYGQPGDLIWAREQFAYLPASAYRGSAGIEQRPSPGCPDMAAVFREGFDRSGRKQWRPSIHMPRWASRLTLRITDVRVERVQDTSESDSIAEGVSDCYEITDPATGEINRDACEAFEELWDSINGPRGYGWDANPWVWALTFDVIHANVDRVVADEQERQP